MKAIVLVGKQNSGKTTTINHFDKEFNENNILKKYCKMGWRSLQFFKGKLAAVFTYVYFIPASPTETKEPLKKKLGTMRPELLLVAEQINGAEYSNTIKFLKKEGYDVTEIVVGDTSSKGCWKDWSSSDFNKKMKDRANEIGNIFRKYIKSAI